MDMSIDLAYQAGRSAFQNGYGREDNPWPKNTERARAWDEGWEEGMSEYSEWLSHMAEGE
jgi:ribosome modulation factor